MQKAKTKLIVGDIHCGMANLIAKARKKTPEELALLRIKHMKHMFEIKENLFLTVDTYNDLAELYNKAVQKGKEKFLYKGRVFTVDYAAFCLYQFDRVDDSFNEEIMAYEMQKQEEMKRHVKK